MRILFILAILAFFTSCHFKQSEADLVVYNAVIYTMDESSTVKQAMAIKDGKIVAMGADRDILNNFRYSESIDAMQQPIYPGFIDAHCHFVGYALGLQNVDLRACKSYSEMIARVKTFAAQNPNAKWIVGRGWDHTDWPGKQFPTKDSLDILFPNTPLLLHRIDGHAALVNQAALDLAKISAGSIIKGGVIEIKSGKPSGLIMENAVDSISKLIPKPTEAELLSALKKAQKKCFEVGLTTVDDAGLDNETLLALAKIYKDKKLDMRMYAMASDLPTNFDYFEKKGAIKGDWFNVHAFKFYADGSLGSRSACMRHPYHDAPGQSGIMTISSDELKGKLARIDAMGFQACTHAIGDSANHQVLKLYAEQLKGGNDKRWRIEHAQVVSKEDLELFKNYTIIPSVQSTHATSDSKWAAERLGGERIKDAYSYKELLAQNGWVALGTDFPVEDINPLNTFYSAVFRKTNSGEPSNGFLMDNALSRQQALYGMTLWAAMSNKEENVKGTLEVGKYADFVILDKDLLKAEEKAVLKTRVVRTVVGGKTVFQK